ncbi:MAG: HAMP domain-containing protein [Nitrospiraceae bacterium]|nr:HAMP domain-containing protein [Nitrospiraceae bacterium]
MRRASEGRFRHLSIGKKLLLSFSLIVGLLLFTLGATLFYLSRVNSYVDRHQRITVPAVVTAAAMQQSVAHMLRQVHHLLEHQPAGEQTATLARIELMHGQTVSALETYRASHAARTHPIMLGMLIQHGRGDLADREDQAMAEVADGLNNLAQLHRTMSARGTGPRSGQETQDGIERQYEHTVERLEGSIGILIDVHRLIDVEMKHEGDRLVAEARLLVLGFVALLGLVIVVTYGVMRHSIASPLRRLATTADRVAHHDLTAQFEAWPNRDEVGGLAAALSSMLISLREQTAAIARKTKELEAFTYSVAHDLKGPLREIEGFSSLLEKEFAEQGDPQVRHHIGVIRTSALRLTHMIDALLKYSRLERQDLPRQHFNVLEMIGNLVNDRLSSSQGPRPKIHLNLPFADLYGEPVSVRQAIVNLLDNALKFSRQASAPDIHIGGRQTGSERIIWVKDNGIGFDPEQKEKIFGLFERLHAPQDYEGTGVGLAIVKLVMEKHGGRAWAETTPGEGSTFFLAFPLH